MPVTSSAGNGVALKRLPWVAWAWFGALLLLSYAPVLWRLVRQWDSDPDMGHGFFVPLVVGFIVWQKRAELLALKPAPNWWGLAVVLYAGLQLWIATLGAELFLARTAFVISVVGIVLLLGGTAWVRALAVPLFLLFFMIPIPTVVYNSITVPLQLPICPRAGDPSIPAVLHDSDPHRGVQQHHLSLATSGHPGFHAGAGPDADPGAARRQRAGARRAEAIGSRGVQRNTLAAIADLPVAGLWILLRKQRVDARGAVRLDHPHRHRGQCQPRDAHRRIDRVQARIGRGFLPYGFRLGDFHGRAGYYDCAAPDSELGV